MHLRHFPQPNHWPCNGAYPDDAEAGEMKVHIVYSKGLRAVEAQFFGIVICSITVFDI